MSNLLSGGLKWYLFNFDGTFNTVKTIALWLTIVLVLTYLITTLVLKDDNRKKFARFGGIALVLYACVLGIAFLIFELNDNKDDLNMLLLVPLLVLLVAIGINTALLVLVKNRTIILIESAITVGGAFVATIVCMIIKYAKEGFDGLNSLPLYLSAVIVLAIIIAVTMFIGRNDKKGFDTRAITYGASAVAMSYALSYLRIFKMPQGGSVTVVAVLPLMIYSYMFGIKKGVFVGFVYGLLQALQDPWIVHPAQFLLDYPIAYCCIGLAGCFRYVKGLDNLPQVQLALGGIVAGCGRYIMHFLSGVLAFASYAGDQNAVIYSLGYNSYVFVDIAIAIVVGVILFCSKTFVKAVKQYSTKEEVTQEN